MDTLKPQALTREGAPVSGSVETPVVTALVERAQGGDAQAFDHLMRLYERQIISIGVQMGLSHEDALDACQDAFVKVFRYIGRFRTGESFYRWLYRIAINAIHDHRRWSHPARVISLEDMDASDTGHFRDSGNRPDEQAEIGDLASKLLAELDCLSERERIVFVLRDLQDLSTEEIGRALHLSQITIRRHCMSARHKLRDRLFGRKR